MVHESNSRAGSRTIKHVLFDLGFIIAFYTYTPSWDNLQQPPSIVDDLHVSTCFNSDVPFKHDHREIFLNSCRQMSREAVFDASALRIIRTSVIRDGQAPEI